MGKRHIAPQFGVALGLFAQPTPRGGIVGLTPCKIIILSHERIPQIVLGRESGSPPYTTLTITLGNNFFFIFLCI